MIIFGWGKRTVKQYGELGQDYCNHCANLGSWSYNRYRTWFTLFFIPVIPYQNIYVKECNICGNYVPLSKEEFFSELGNCKEEPCTSSSTDMHNDGLTEVQRNYRRQMAELRKEK